MTENIKHPMLPEVEPGNMNLRGPLIFLTIVVVSSAIVILFRLTVGF